MPSQLVYNCQKFYITRTETTLGIIVILKEEFDGPHHNISYILYLVTPTSVSLHLQSRSYDDIKGETLAVRDPEHEHEYRVNIKNIDKHYTANRAIMRGIKVLMQTKNALSKNYSISFHSKNIAKSIEDSIGYEFKTNIIRELFHVIYLENGNIIVIIDALNYVAHFKDYSEFNYFCRYFGTVNLVFNSVY